MGMFQKQQSQKPSAKRVPPFPTKQTKNLISGQGGHPPLQRTTANRLPRPPLQFVAQLEDLVGGGDLLSADVNHRGRCYGMETLIGLFFSGNLFNHKKWQFFLCFGCKNGPFSMGFFPLITWGGHWQKTIFDYKTKSNIVNRFLLRLSGNNHS